MEAARADDAAGGSAEAKSSPGKRRQGTAEDGAEEPRRCQRRVADRSKKEEEVDIESVLERLASSFAEDYWLSPTVARPLSQSLLRRLMDHEATAPGPEAGPEAGSCAAKPLSVADILSERKDAWLHRLQLGFSLLVEGIGSKRLLLETFADEVLAPWGADVAIFSGFDSRGSLLGFLKELLAQAFPALQRSGGSSAESLVAALRAARSAMPPPVRPLALVVHNLEALPPWHQAALAALTSAPGVLLVSSVDNLWAPLAWTAAVAKDFNFFREEVHTFQGYETEINCRYPDGLPAWCDPSADRQQASKASIGLVLRSLTNNHRELCEAMAQNQLTEDGRGGISMGDLLTIAEDRMIASNGSKLRSLLTELKDHEVIMQRAGSDGGTLFFIPYRERVIQKLANGETPDDSDGEGKHAEEDDDDDEDDGEESGAGED